MITDSKKWDHLAVKNLNTLLKRTTSKTKGNFYCLNYLHSFRAKNKVELDKRICENHDYCCIEIMSTGDNKILK